MTKLTIRLDMRAPAFADTPDDYYRTALDMAQWADERGFDECMLSEHHGADDGYLPSPLVFGAAVAARTRRLRIRVSALVLPLHDPLRVAEDVAVLDRISGGRAELVVVGGFRPHEFAMFGADMAERGRMVEEGVAVLRQAWTGEPFSYRGRSVQVTPRPLQRPCPPVLLGGSSPAAARRAARIGDGFVPAVPELYEVYRAECDRLRRSPGKWYTGPLAVFVSRDPEATWAEIAAHVLHETNSYARWYAESGVTGPYQPIEDIELLKGAGIYQVLTPAQCIELARSLGVHAQLLIQPLLAGLDPAVGWESLRLLESEVLPALQAGQPQNRAERASSAQQ